MFLVLSSYQVEFEPDDPRVEAHREFLRQQAAAGRVLVSGPRSPRIGGVTVFTVQSEQDLRALLAQDTMRQAGMVDDEIIQFTAAIAAEDQHLDPSSRS